MATSGGGTLPPSAYTLDAGDSQEIGNLAGELRTFNVLMGTVNLVPDATALISGLGWILLDVAGSPYEILLANNNSLLQSPTGLSVTTVSEPITSQTVGGAIIQTAVDILLTADDNIVSVFNGASPVTIQLPAAAGITGRIYIIKRGSPSTGTVTISPVTGTIQTLSGTFAASTTLEPLGSYGQSQQFQSDGTSWHRIN